MGAELLLSGADDIDFMIHGVFQYELFGQKLWITTTHVCLFIVMAIIIIFCLCANRAIKRATEVPGTFLLFDPVNINGVYSITVSTAQCKAKSVLFYVVFQSFIFKSV